MYGCMYVQYNTTLRINCTNLDIRILHTLMYQIDFCYTDNVLTMELDFKNQKSWLSETVEKYPGCQLIFYPKFHCELNFIEMVWPWAKAHHRSTCTYKYNDLKTGLTVKFDELMPISCVRKAFDQCLRFMHGYRSGLFGHVLEHAVKNTRAIVASLLQ